MEYYEMNSDLRFQLYLSKVKELYKQYMSNNKSVEMLLPEKIKYLAQELELMFDLQIGIEKNPKDVQYLQELQAIMLTKKHDLDIKLINNSISSKDYAEKVNNLMFDFIKESTNYMGKENFIKLFNFNPDNNIKIIDPNILDSALHTF